jgi:hypothetical protein
VSVRYYDRQGRPLKDCMAWAKLSENRDYYVVAQHWVRGWMVATVWLGLDHNFLGSGAPVIFETMILPPGDEAGEHGIWDEQYMERYSTEAAAQAGHDRALSWLRGKIGEDALADIVGPLMPGSSDEKWDGSVEGEL